MRLARNIVSFLTIWAFISVLPSWTAPLESFQEEAPQVETYGAELSQEVTPQAEADSAEIPQENVSPTETDSSEPVQEDNVRGETDSPEVAPEETVEAEVAFPELAQVPKKKKVKSWETQMSVKGDLRYDDNVFRLSGGKKDVLDNDLAVSPTRFENMQSSGDTVFAPTLNLKIRGPGYKGRNLFIEGKLRTHLHTWNRVKNYAKLDLGIEQTLSKKSSTGLWFDYTPNYFPKNYFVDAIDTTGTPDEVDATDRIYAAGNYSEWDATWFYRRQLSNKKKNGMFLLVGGGYLGRGYRNLLTLRNRSALHWDLKFNWAPIKRWRARVDYRLTSSSSPRMLTVMVLDENFFGIDFNENGTVTDKSARAEQMVDRSYGQHLIGIEFEKKLKQGKRLEFGYQHRHRMFSSQEVYDLNYRERTDHRHRLGVKFTKPLSEMADLVVGYSYKILQAHRLGDPNRLNKSKKEKNSNLTGDPTVHEMSTRYTQGNFFVTLNFRF